MHTSHYLLMQQSMTLRWTLYDTRRAEKPYDALYQLKSCQMLRNCTLNPISKGLQQVKDLVERRQYQ